MARGTAGDQPRGRGALALGVALGLLAMLAGLAWIIPVVVAWAHSGEHAHLTVVDAVRAATSGQLLGRAPASAYPPDVAALLPARAEFWALAGLVMVAAGAALFALGRTADIRMSRPAPDRRWWQLRGRRPHDFARYRTIPELIVDGPAPDRLVVGYVARPRALVSVSPTAQIAVLAAPRTGKSSGLVIPAILEHEGAVIATSVRTDIAAHTVDRRRRMGRVFVWDPFGPQTDAWDLLQGCEDWEHALLVARWLGQARKLGGTANQDYFEEEAEGLIAPYLHAAALTPEVTAAGVYRWILDRDDQTAERILADVGADDARERLKAVYAYTERQRDGIIGTAAVQLKAYGHPAAVRTANRASGLTPEELFDGPNTLYIVAGRDHQQLLAPLVVTMISSLLYWISERENRTGTGLSPLALFALDETASIAPIQDLPQILATSLGSGARFMTVWHSVAQIRRYFGPDAAAEILALSQAKIFMGSITDQYTREEIVNLMGHRQRMRGDQLNPGRTEVMSAQALQRTSAGEGLLINGDLPPVVFKQRRHYLDRSLRGLKGAGPRGEGVVLFSSDGAGSAEATANRLPSAPAPMATTGADEPETTTGPAAPWDFDPPPWLEPPPQAG